MNKSLQDLAVAWWIGLSTDAKVNIANFHRKSVEDATSHEIINMYLYETTDTMCACGKLQSQHQPNYNPPDEMHTGYTQKTVTIGDGIMVMPETVVYQPCICDACYKAYAYDLTVPDELWAVISPKKMDGWKSGGLLCPECILKKTIEFYTITIKKLTDGR